MSKFNSLALASMVGSVLTGCSTQQVTPQSQVVQNTQQSQVSQVPVVAATNIASPRVVAAKVAQSRVVAVRPAPVAVARAKVIPVRARPAVVKRPVLKPRVTPVRAKPAAVVKRAVARPRVIPAAPRVQTVRKPTPTVSGNQAPWLRRQLSMSLMPSWTMSGRAALRFQNNSSTFGLTWIQRNKQQFTLQIKNPITGTIHAVIEQRPGKATLNARGKVSTGVDAERLLQQQMGVKMPVNGMPYWVRGVMAPQYPVGKVVLDAKGRPKQIVQAGWVMDYFNYQNLSFDALPQKVNISRKQERVNVRVLAKQWKTR